MNRSLWGGGLALALALSVIAVGVFVWGQRLVVISGPIPTPLPRAAAPVAAAPAPPPAMAYPIEAAASGAPAAALDPLAVLTDLFGRKAALGMFQVDDFAHRFAATVDNLARPTASSRLWPVNPAAGRFTVERDGDGEVVAADNGLRYTAFVQLLESVDPKRAAAAYVRFYPALQKAYEDLGYPGRYFNDRVVEVIDVLLATPDVEGPLKVHLAPINGPVQPARPWVLYEFDDPALQGLTAGQNMLLLMGPVNERRVKARLVAFRQIVAAGGATR
jgi:hypothetical protein